MPRPPVPDDPRQQVAHPARRSETDARVGQAEDRRGEDEAVKRNARWVALWTSAAVFDAMGALSARAYGAYEQRQIGTWFMIAAPSTSQPIVPTSAQVSVG